VRFFSYGRKGLSGIVSNTCGFFGGESYGHDVAANKATQTTIMITTTINVDADECMTIERIYNCSKQLRDSADLLEHYAKIAEAGLEPPETISRRVETAICFGCIIAVEKFGGTVRHTKLLQP
jgi:hypothetical protein